MDCGLGEIRLSDLLQIPYLGSADPSEQHQY